MRRIVSAVMLTLLAAAASAQESQSLPSGVQAGARVRATAPSVGTVSGRVIAVHGDIVDLKSDQSRDTVHIVASQLTALDVSTAQHTRRLAGTGIGFLSGAVLGGVLGAATYRKPDCSGEVLFCDLGPGFDATAGAVLLGGVGAVVGLLVGSVSVDTWEPVALRNRSQLDLLVPAGARGVGVAASLRF